MSEPGYQLAIIGGGPVGIPTAQLLRERGITGLVIVERRAEFGGTRRENHYPVLAVDIPTLSYQFPFAPNPNCSRFLAPGPKIHQYLVGCPALADSLEGDASPCDFGEVGFGSRCPDVGPRVVVEAETRDHEQPGLPQ